jgi:hypothetical protein
MRSGALLSIMLVAAPAAAAHLVFARGDWAAIDFGTRCEARSRMLEPPPKLRPPPFAGFLFDPGGPAQGEFYAHLSRPAGTGSATMLVIGDQRFLLIARGEWAWSRSPAQAQAIVTAARSGGGMRIDVRDQAGRRYADRYGLADAATAIDAAAAACAGKVG